MKKKLALVLAIALMCSAMVFSGCGQEGSGSTTGSNPSSATNGTSDYVIGFVPMTLNNEYFITMVNAAQQKADELGVKLEVQAGDQHASAADQLTIVENLITSGVDAICIVPSSSEGLEASLRKCKDAGIPVINLDTILDESIVKAAGVEVPFYGTDNYAGAKIAGEYVKEHFEAGTKVAILTGISGQQNAADRRDGFIAGAGDAIEVVAEQSANWEVDQGYAAAQNILTSNPDLGLIYCGNDGMAIGAYRAVEEAKLQDQVKVIGFDGVSEALSMVENGQLLATVAQDPAKMGMMGVENAVNLLDGKEIEMKVDTGAKLILQDNVKEQQEYNAQFAD